MHFGGRAASPARATSIGKPVLVAPLLAIPAGAALPAWGVPDCCWLCWVAGGGVVDCAFATLVVEVTRDAATIIAPNCAAKFLFMRASGGYWRDYTPQTRPGPTRVSLQSMMAKAAN